MEHEDKEKYMTVKAKYNDWLPHPDSAEAVEAWPVKTRALGNQSL